MTNVIDIETGKPVSTNVIFEAAPEKYWPHKHYRFDAICGEEGLGVDLSMIAVEPGENGCFPVFMSHWISAAEAERFGNALIEAVRSGRVTDLDD